MKCRFCEKELVDGGERRFETLCDHVSDPNATQRPLRPTYICDDSECLANTVAVGYWSEEGTFYYKNWGAEELKPYGERLSAIDSFDMKMDIEIYKKDENFIFWKGLKWKLRIDYKYEANEKGEILKRTPKLTILRRDFNSIKDMFFFWDWRRNGWIYHTTNLSMLKFCKGQYVRTFNQILEANEEKEVKRTLFFIREFHKIIEDKDHYKKWGRQSKPWHIIHATYDWYRPVFSKWASKRSLKDLDTIGKILEEMKC